MIGRSSAGRTSEVLGLRDPERVADDDEWIEMRVAFERELKKGPRNDAGAWRSRSKSRIASGS